MPLEFALLPVKFGFVRYAIRRSRFEVLFGQKRAKPHSAWSVS
jgi:hypothetical protein